MDVAAAEHCRPWRQTMHLYFYPDVHPALRQFTSAVSTPEMHNEMRRQLIIAGADGDLDAIIKKAVGNDPVVD
jgi:hypothetical protein